MAVIRISRHVHQLSYFYFSDAQTLQGLKQEGPGSVAVDAGIVAAVDVQWIVWSSTVGDRTKKQLTCGTT